MVGVQCSAWLQLSLLLLCAMHSQGLRHRTHTSSQHTLNDQLRPTITPADVAHNDVNRFIQEGLMYMSERKIALDEDCEDRFGYTFISEQKRHFFRLCKSEAYRKSDGTLGNVTRHTPLSRMRRKMARKQMYANLTMAQNATANATSAVARRMLSQRSSGDEDGGAWGPRRRARAMQEAAPHLGRALTANSSLMYRLITLVQQSGAAKKRPWANTGQEADQDLSDVYNDDDNNPEAEQQAQDAVNQAIESDQRSKGSSSTGSSSSNSSSAAANAAMARPPLPASTASYYSYNYFESDMEQPHLTAVGKHFKSSVGCYLNPLMPRHIGYKDAQVLCTARNFILDTCALYNGENTGFDIRFPQPKVGAVRLACTMNIRALNERNLTKGRKNRLWWNDAVDNAYEEVGHACDPSKGKVVEHPVAFILRDRYTHTLHELEMFTSIFTSLAVADLPEVREKGVQIVIADSMPHASYRATYAAISYPYRLRHLAEDPYPNGTCFRTALFINAFTNSMAWNPNPNTSSCFSPIMLGVHRWLRTLHKELDPTYLAKVHHHASETGGIIRRSIVWTSRRNLEALRLTSGAGMTTWQSARMVPNENEVVVALQRAVLEWNSKNCLLHRYYQGDQDSNDCRESNVQFDLVFGEFSDWPYYPDQLMTIYRTGILIGVHGAALTFIASTTAGESACLELAGINWEDTQTGNMLNLFPSLSRNMDAYYEQVRYPGPDVDTTIAAEALVRGMDEVSKRIMAKQAKERDLKAAHFNDQYNFDVMFPHACPTTHTNKTRRYVTMHEVQINSTNITKH